ncbi:MAG: hypothetical protein ACR2NU_03515, partial [Aeoliella sp.]
SWCVALAMLLVVELLNMSGFLDDRELLLRARPISAQGGGFGGGGDQFNVPESPADNPSPESEGPDFVLEYDHGWPTPWLRRALGYGEDPWRLSTQTGSVPALKIADYPIAWSAPMAWPLSADAWKIHTVGLLVNLLVGALLIGIPTACCEWWLRSRGGLWRFRLIDVLAVMTLVGTGFGFWRWDQSEMEREQAYFPTSNVTISYKSVPMSREQPEYCGPVWLERLVGNRELIPLMRRHAELSFTPGFDDPSLLQSAHQLRHLERLRFYGLPNREMSKAISQLSRLRELHICHGYYDWRFRRSEPFPDFETLAKSSSLERVEIRHIDVQVVDILPLMKSANIRELVLGIPYIEPVYVEWLNQQYPDVDIIFEAFNHGLHLLNRMAVKRAELLRSQERRKLASPARLSSRLDMSDVLVTDDRLSGLGPELPHLDYLEIKDADLTVDGIRILAEKSTVNRVAITGDWLDDELLLAIGDIRSLQFLGVRQGDVTFDGFVQFMEKKRLATLRIDDCTLSEAELDELDAMSNQTGLMINGEWR